MKSKIYFFIFYSILKNTVILSTKQTLLKAYAKNKMPNQALDCFKKLEEIFGCKHGIRSYNAFIKVNQLEKAVFFIRLFWNSGYLA